MSYGPPSLEPCCLATAAPSRCLWLGAVAGRRGAAASAAPLASSTAARWAAVARRCARLAHQVWWNVDSVNSTHLQFKGVPMLSVEPRNLYESVSYSTHLPNSFPLPHRRLAATSASFCSFRCRASRSSWTFRLSSSAALAFSAASWSCIPTHRRVMACHGLETSWTHPIGWCFRLEGWGLIGLMLLKSQLLHQLLSL